MRSPSPVRSVNPVRFHLSCASYTCTLSFRYVRVMEKFPCDNYTRLCFIPVCTYVLGADSPLQSRFIRSLEYISAASGLHVCSGADFALQSTVLVARSTIPYALCTPVFIPSFSIPPSPHCELRRRHLLWICRVGDQLSMLGTIY
jgi:hypothetical protein